MLLNFTFMLFIQIDIKRKLEFGYFFLQKLLKTTICKIICFYLFCPTNIGGLSTQNGYLRKFEACISKTNTQI